MRRSPRTHLAHKAEHGVDRPEPSSGELMREGDSATLPEMTMAAEQVEAVSRRVRGSRRWSPTRATTATRRWWRSTRLGSAATYRSRSGVVAAGRTRRRGRAGEACCAAGVVWEPPSYSRTTKAAWRVGGAAFRDQYETGGLRRVWVRGHENVRKRVLIQAAGCNLGLLLRGLTGVHAPEPAGAGSFGHLRTDRLFDRLLGASDGHLGVQMETGGVRRLNRSSPSCLNRPAQRTDFFHGLLWCDTGAESVPIQRPGIARQLGSGEIRSAGPARPRPLSVLRAQGERSAVPRLQPAARLSASARLSSVPGTRSPLDSGRRRSRHARDRGLPRD